MQQILFRFENRQPLRFRFRAIIDPRIGIEYDYDGIVAVRAGVNDIGNLTLGAGIHLRKIDVDYSFAKFDAADELGNSHRISLRIKIEEEQFKR